MHDSSTSEGNGAGSVYISDAKRENIKACDSVSGDFSFWGGASRLEKTFPPRGFDTIIFGAPLARRAMVVVAAQLIVNRIN